MRHFVQSLHAFVMFAAHGCASLQAAHSVQFAFMQAAGQRWQTVSRLS